MKQSKDNHSKADNDADKLIHHTHIIALDGLRGFAVLMVLLAHAYDRGISPFADYINLKGSYFGVHGVFIFFVLSAYLLTKQFLDSDATDKNFIKFTGEYFYRRFLRIYPLFVISLLAILCLRPNNRFSTLH